MHLTNVKTNLWCIEYWYQCCSVEFSEMMGMCLIYTVNMELLATCGRFEMWLQLKDWNFNCINFNELKCKSR